MAASGKATPALRFKIINLDALESLGKDLIKMVDARTLKNATRGAANEVKKGAMARVPVLTGELKRSLAVSTPKPRLRGTIVSARVGARPPVSRRVHFVEFGVPSRGIPPKPFLRTAAADSGVQKNALEKASNTIKKRVRRVLVKQGGKWKRPKRTRK